ncbi:efflux RND transporter periplasmic adaptor subunit [Aquisphaera insulae]|uniref:efflux RND transporter periplasmic adaptor subunit n=1 Tax=Aquisphaera insulae TaxID=2712864 RepID=UPI0013E9B23C|nr:efflux RND transporter periplasmic adaptor subunit [Aquisphaera insulae]
MPPLKRPSRRKRAAGKVFVVGLVGLLAVAGVAFWSVPGLSKPIRSFFKPAEVDVVPYEVKAAVLPITVGDKGALESSKNQDVLCKVEGSTTIISILPEGSKVKKGELVCELDSATLKDSLTNQKISTQSAEASYQNSKLTREVAQIAVKEYVEGIYLQDKATIEGEIKLAESDLKRSEDRVDWSNRMYEKGYVSKASKVSEELTYQKAKFSLEQAENKRNVLEQYTKQKTIKELNSEVEKALSDELAKKQTLQIEKEKEAKLETQIANCKLFAPGDGIVVYANDPMKNFGSTQPQIEEGATVRERQKIFSLPDIQRMQVNAKVHESQIDKIAMGMKAKIRVDAFADTELEGTVQEVAPLPDPSSFFSSDIKVYTTKVRIENPLPGLRPGMNAEVTILVDRKENVLSVPVQAILEYGGKDHVMVRTPNGFDRREVELGATNDKFIEITKGITAGNVVALNPTVLLSEEQRREMAGSGRGASKKDWGPMAKGKEGEAGPPGGAPGKAGPGGAPGKGELAAKGGDPAKAKGKGARGRGGPGGGAFFEKFKNIAAEDKAKLKTGTEEEKAEIFKKAGFTDEELEQMKNFRPGGGGGPGGPPGGGGGGGFGGPPGGGGGN